MHVDERRRALGSLPISRRRRYAARYLDHVGLDEGWLLMFDLRATQSWDARLTTRELEHRGKRVHIIGC